jgi:stearoyl-CoA desaturase (Delta-9 desaturase)
MMFSGLLDLPWWGELLAALALTHVTIAGVTIYLHRCQAHRALDLHPAVAHFLRFWLWLTTGMVTKEWVAIHRKHHAKCETAEDPHSPQIYGINRVLWAGVFLYVKESFNKETLERYGHGTPDDWIERTLYSRRYSYAGVFSLLGIYAFAFGIVPGVLVWLVQVAWIPFWAAGVINGVGHFFGYRSYDVADASTNIVPWGILIGGEELHNNHHAFASSAKLSSQWYEFDVGWMYIRILEKLGLASIKRVAPKPRFAGPKATADLDTLHAVIANRYEVLSRYGKSLTRTYAEELERLKHWSPRDAEVLRSLKPALLRGQVLAGAEAAKLAEALGNCRALGTVIAMRDELTALWERSSASKEQLLRHLQAWCIRAEASGVAALADFSQRLRSYA